jgi:hypothetical protein
MISDNRNCGRFHGLDSHYSELGICKIMGGFNIFYDLWNSLGFPIRAASLELVLEPGLPDDSAGH